MGQCSLHLLYPKLKSIVNYFFFYGRHWEQTTFWWHFSRLPVSVSMFWFMHVYQIITAAHVRRLVVSGQIISDFQRPELESYTQQIFTNNLYFCKDVILLHVTKCKMLLLHWSNEIHSVYTEHIFLKEWAFE